jgi:hypothetical protein
MLFASPLDLSIPWRWMMRSSDDPANRKSRTFVFGMVTPLRAVKWVNRGRYSPHATVEDNMLTFGRLGLHT